MKTKNDAACSIFGVIILCSMLLATILDDNQPEFAKTFLTWALCVIGSVAVLKFVLLYATVHQRAYKLTAIYSISLQVAEGVLLTVLYFLSFDKEQFDGDIQAWLWETEGKDWWQDIACYWFALYQYYYIFFLAMISIFLVVALFIWIFADPQTEEEAVAVAGGPATQTNLQRQNTSANLSKLSRYFDWTKFNDHEECSICLEPFTASDQVTPLPCDKRHYFHSNCIQEWSQNHNDCPLCKKEFTADSLAEA